MSYKIGVLSLVAAPILNKAYISCATSQRPKTSLQMQPERIPPDKMPDPWLLDTEHLIQEVARIRELALRIPPIRNDIIGPINSVIDAAWDLEQRLRFCFQNRCEAHNATQRAFREAAAKQSPKRQTKPIDRQAEARPANARRKA